VAWRSSARSRAGSKLKGDNHDQEAGIKIVMKALEEPLRIIVAARARVWSLTHSVANCSLGVERPNSACSRAPVSTLTQSAHGVRR